MSCYRKDAFDQVYHHGCPVSFLKKKDRPLGLFIDFRDLNKTTITMTSTLYNIYNLFDQLPSAEVISKFNNKDRWMSMESWD